MVDMVLLIFKHFHTYCRGGWSHSFPLKMVDAFQFPEGECFKRDGGGGGFRSGLVLPFLSFVGLS